MAIIASWFIGISLGITSHLGEPLWGRVEGAIEGLTVVSGATWLFVVLGVWWWLAIFLGIVVFALYLVSLKALTAGSVKKGTALAANLNVKKSR